MNDTQRSEYVCTIQQRIAELARERPHECFTALNHSLTVDWLKAAYERVKPASAPGVDGQSLHEVLDCWYVEEVKPRMKGRVFLVRFADDFILGFERKEDAEKVYRVLFKRL